MESGKTRREPKTAFGCRGSGYAVIFSWLLVLFFYVFLRGVKKKKAPKRNNTVSYTFLISFYFWINHSRKKKALKEEI